MNFLQTTRVAVIDDELAEAEPLLCSISKSGIGALYFNGIGEQLPAKPLSGLRLLFLDLHLVNSGDAHGILSTTVGILSHIVSPSKGEVGIVCWTKHAEEQKQFEDLLKERYSAFQPAFVLAVPKREFFAEFGYYLDKIRVEAERLCKTLPPPSTENPHLGTAIEVANAIRNIINEAFGASEKEKERRNKFNFAELNARVDAVLAPKNGSKLMWTWEQSVHEAAGGTTTLLHTVCGDANDADVHQKNMMSLFASLVIGAGGRAVNDIATCASSLSEGLNPIHSDFLDQYARMPSASDPAFEALLALVQTTQGLSGDKQSQINAALLTAKPAAGANRFEPGNLYSLANGASPDGTPHNYCNVDKSQVAHGIIIPKYDETASNFRKRIDGRAKLGLKEEEVVAAKEQLNAHLNDLFKTMGDQCEIGLLEITPACDFANKSYAPGRFIGCVLVPDALKNNIEDKGDFTMRLKPLSLPGKTGIWHVVLNSRFVFGVSNPHSLIKAPPLIRIRLPLLIDIQAWFAAQSARPGHIAV